MRKSAEQRISDVKAAIDAWAAAGIIAGDRRVVFMRDSLTRLELGKGLSTKQREWLDTLCAEGPPAPKGDPALLARIDAALPHLTPRGREAMTSFRGTLTRGYELSEKQTSFMTKLLDEAGRVAVEGKWKPSPELLAEGTFAARVIDSRGSMWKGSHPGTVTAANRILSTLGIDCPDSPDEWCFRKVIEAVGPAVREFRDPKFEAGELVWVKYVRPDGPAEVALIVSGPEAVNGSAGYAVMIGGAPMVVPLGMISRSAPLAGQTQGLI